MVNKQMSVAKSDSELLLEADDDSLLPELDEDDVL